MEKEKEKKKYPIGAEYYTLYEEVGTGASATVSRAQCIPLNEIVAVKIMDFERSNCNLNNISRESQLMFLVDHPNVLKSHCSFVCDHNLWVVMPYMAGGSCLHILKAAHPDGFEEVVIATILREVLKGLDYLHQHGQIHRDVKAGNILIDSHGGIKLGDFGVSACLFDSGWPEVMEQMHGYDFKADIWSFGITALELAHGHAPFSKYPPLKVLLITLQNAPPGLDYERDKKFSKRHEEDMLAQKKMPDGEKEEISQNEYNRGISGWNFNLEDLKAQASLDDDTIIETDGDLHYKQLQHQSLLSRRFSLLQHQSSSASQHSDTPDSDDNAHISLSSVDSTTNTMKSEKSDDDASVSGSKIEHSATDTSPGPETLVEKPVPEVNKRSSDGAPASSNQRDKVQSQSQNSLSSVITNLQILDDAHPETIPRSSKTSCKSMSGDEVDEKTKNTVVRQKGRFKVTSESADIEKVVPGPMLPKSHSMQVIAQRLSIASPLPSPLPPTTPSLSPYNTTQSNPLAQALFPCLQYVLHTNIMERDSLLTAMKQVGYGDCTGHTMLNAAVTEKSLLEVAHDREKELIREMTDLLSRLLCIQDELQKCKAESAQDNRNCCYMLSTCPETAPVTVGKCLQPTIRH
ncbi:UNVERIFIED_CONTAM: Serine/threonine-protein kinase fray2 [Sesamum angustifolium]|uniref:Serine/threonine-protein kinase fray2 n=1 Tax=Sesamum angustifolium TaxID=2727405 RepID=A0AAW2RJT7_9LAMI